MLLFVFVQTQHSHNRHNRLIAMGSCGGCTYTMYMLKSSAGDERVSFLFARKRSKKQKKQSEGGHDWAELIIFFCCHHAPRHQQKFYIMHVTTWCMYWQYSSLLFEELLIIPHWLRSIMIRILLLAAVPLLAAADAMGWNLADCPSMEVASTPNLKGCAYRTFPLDRDNDPTGSTVNSFTRVFYTGESSTDEAVFLIEGGPGFSNHAFIPVADFLLSLNPGWTIYLQDHRGTGLSSPVNCAENPSVRTLLC